MHVLNVVHPLTDDQIRDLGRATGSTRMVTDVAVHIEAHRPLADQTRVRLIGARPTRVVRRGHPARAVRWILCDHHSDALPEWLIHAGAPAGRHRASQAEQVGDRLDQTRPVALVSRCDRGAAGGQQRH